MLYLEKHSKAPRGPIVHQGRKKALQESSTTWRFRSTRQPSNKEGWYQAASKVTKGRQAVYFLLVNSMDLNIDKKYKAHKHLKPHRGTVNVVDMAGAQKENFEFRETLNGCVICFVTIPREYIKICHADQGQGRDIREESRCGCTHTVKEIVGVRTVENNMYLYCQRFLKDTFVEETLCAIHKQIPQIGSKQGEILNNQTSKRIR